MSEGQMIFAISSGDYSDYGVSCLFEREEDALAYIAAQGYTERSEANYRNEWRKPGERWNSCFVEEFQFWPAGVVPHVEAERS